MTSGDGFPSGYCFSFCNVNDRLCGGDGVCHVSSSNTDAIGQCYDGCAYGSDCRYSYDCYSFPSGDFCYPCSLSGESCTTDVDCCYGTCDSGTCS
jgi:hypothetical protein